MVARAPSCAPSPGEDGDAVGPELRSLVQAYVAYLSGCDACTLESLRAAHATNEDLSRLHLLPTWRRAPFRTYTDRERAALVWAEVVAISGAEGLGEALRREASELFRADELDALTRSVLTAPGWRRLMLEREADGAPGGRGRSRRARHCRSQASCDLCLAS